ncbi:hypothetical protein DFQ28_009682 [Apophysomyces sp. BC1034]|nr:hypothetical protein DFQ30_006135 [Apophysomyces sp. BC1015]KAG0181358.1 hypothetical protein DFQ29_008496 [Apophysomyces sp. BC1021]KAG0185239.1 hypothetical protein DFQ28_009682 [Apophysomyces sp. BC1034]
MSDHVVYACPCLNIKLHLANKYTLEGHEDQRKVAWKHLDNPSLEGWQFDLGMGGIVVFGREIDISKEDDRYSDTFGIKVKDTKETVSFTLEENAASGELYSQHRHIRELLDQSLERMQQEADARIERFQKNETQKLHESTSLAKQERDALWAKIVEVSKKVNEKQREQAVGGKEEVLDSTGHPHEHSAGQGASAESHPKTSHVHFAEGSSNTGVVSSKSEQKSVVVPDSVQPSVSHLSGIPMSFKRKSFGLDESGITSSLKNSNLAEMTTALPDNMDDREQHDSDEESEDMFHLDEEISSDEESRVNDYQPKGSVGDENTENDAKPGTGSSPQGVTDRPSGSSYITPSWHSPSSSWLKKKRSTGKYIDAFDEEPNDQNRADSSADIDHEMGHSISMYATSLPIAISHPEHVMVTKAEETENAVRPSDRDPTKSTRSEKKITESPRATSSYVNYDYSLADRETSQLFPQVERRRKSVAIGATRGPKPQLFSLVGESLDTRSARIRKKDLPATHREAVEQLRKFAEVSDDEEDEEHGQMVPPHILAARTYTDETEELFGAVPRSQMWQRTME